MRENRDLTVSTAPTQSVRDSNTISIPDNSATRKSDTRITTGIMTDTPSTFSEETDVTAIHAEIPENSKCIRITTGLSFLLIYKL